MSAGGILCTPVARTDTSLEDYLILLREIVRSRPWNADSRETGSRAIRQSEVKGSCSRARTISWENYFQVHLSHSRDFLDPRGEMRKILWLPNRTWAKPATGNQDRRIWIVEFDGERYCVVSPNSIAVSFIFLHSLLVSFNGPGFIKDQIARFLRYRLEKRRCCWETGFITSFCSICSRPVPSYVKLCL